VTGARPSPDRPPPRSVDGGLDEVPLPRTAGRLWLCGKHLVGPHPEAALDRAGASTVICLSQEHELGDRYPDYVAWLRSNRGRRAVWFPVPDLHVPEVGEALRFLEEVGRRLGGGEGLLMHCGAGIGRAGTLAVGVLLSLGTPADEAVATVAASRPMAGPEAGAQRQLVEALAARLSP
jgi:protein-tyrosine phosphatase